MNLLNRVETKGKKERQNSELEERTEIAQQEMSFKQMQ